MQKRQDGFSQLVRQVHFDNYQTHAAQIRHVLAEQGNQRAESRFFHTVVCYSSFRTLDSIAFSFFGHQMHL